MEIELILAEDMSSYVDMLKLLSSTSQAFGYSLVITRDVRSAVEEHLIVNLMNLHGSSIFFEAIIFSPHPDISVTSVGARLLRSLSDDVLRSQH